MQNFLKPAVALVILAILLFAPILFVHDYAEEVTANLSENAIIHLNEVNKRAAAIFYQTVRADMMEIDGVARYMAQQRCCGSREETLAVAPLLYAHGLRRFSIVDVSGKGFDGGGEAVDYSRNPAFLRAVQGLTHVSAAQGTDGRRALIIAKPLVIMDGVQAILICEFPARGLENSMETWAFGGNVYNAVIDDAGRPLFWSAPPGKTMDDLFSGFSEQGLPDRFITYLQQEATHVQDTEPVFSEGGGVFSSQSYLSRFGWRVVSLVPAQVGNATVSRQNTITDELVWRVAFLGCVALVLVFLGTRKSWLTLRRQQEDYRSIIASLSGGVIKFTGLEGSFLFMSGNFLNMLGFTKEEFEKTYGNNFASTIYEPDRQHALEAMRRQITRKLPIDVEYRTRAKSGALIWLCHKGSVMQLEHGHAYIQSIVFDVTSSKNAALDKRISDERYQFILEQHNINVFEHNLITGHFSCSAQWLQTFGRVFNILEPQLPGNKIPIFPEDQERLNTFQLEMKNSAHQGKKALEARLRDAKGEYHWFCIEASSIVNSQGVPIYAIGIMTDIDRRKTLELKLRSQASRDSSTGMRNKLATEKAVTQFLDTHDSPLPEMYAMFIIDLDNFKVINDRFGHAVGDSAIFNMAQIIRRNFRPLDIVGRVGGDEFLVFCTEKMSMQSVRERAMTLVRQLHTEYCDQRSCLTLTASVGVACCPDDGVTYAELFNKADKATYAAKRMGKNCCVFYDEVPRPESNSVPVQ